MEYYSALEREGMPTPATDGMRPEHVMLSEISQSQTDIVQVHFSEVPRVVKFMEIENRMVVARGGGM